MTCFCERFSKYISHQCRGATALDNFFLATKHGFIKLGTLMPKIINFGAVKIQTFFGETSLHPEKIGICFALLRTRIAGPNFFTAMVDANTFQDIITQIISLLK